MKNRRLLHVALIVFSLVSTFSFAAVESVGNAQGEYERSINAIVRNKNFYKGGRIEVGGTAGTMPFDSLINHYMLGGRGTWHFSDHYGWEILDLQLSFPSVTGYTTNLVKEKGISNLQTIKLKMMAMSNFVASPLYGKIRFFGTQVLYFDIYLLAGFGMANTSVLKFSSPAEGTAGSESTVKSGWDPGFDFGFGFRVFLNRALALNLDFRDYVFSSTVYGKKSLKSNFSTMASLSFFIPTF